MVGGGGGGGGGNLRGSRCHNTSSVASFVPKSFLALIDCLRAKLLENYGVQCFRALDPTLWALNENNANFVPFQHCIHLQSHSPDKNVLLQCISKSRSPFEGFKVLRKAFSKFYRRHYELISKFNVGLKSLLHQCLSEPEFYGDLVYKFNKIRGYH